jgi:transcription elongation factor Elf1
LLQLANKTLLVLHQGQHWQPRSEQQNSLNIVTHSLQQNVACLKQGQADIASQLQLHTSDQSEIKQDANKDPNQKEDQHNNNNMALTEAVSVNIHPLNDSKLEVCDAIPDPKSSRDLNQDHFINNMINNLDHVYQSNDKMAANEARANSARSTSSSDKVCNQPLLQGDIIDQVNSDIADSKSLKNDIRMFERRSTRRVLNDANKSLFPLKSDLNIPLSDDSLPDNQQLHIVIEEVDDNADDIATSFLKSSADFTIDITQSPLALSNSCDSITATESTPTIENFNLFKACERFDEPLKLSPIGDRDAHKNYQPPPKRCKSINIVQDNNTINGNGDGELLWCAVCYRAETNVGAIVGHMNKHFSSTVCAMCGMSLWCKLPQSVMSVPYKDCNDNNNNVNTNIKQSSKDCNNNNNNNNNNVNTNTKQRPANTIFAHNLLLNFRCLQCNKSFRYQSLLLTHIGNNHSDKRPFACSMCEARFKNSSNLNRHERTHSGARPHRCPDCPAAFGRLSDVRVHRRVHTGDKPYTCAVCNKAFSQLGNYYRHVRIHSEAENNGNKPESRR